MRLFVMLAIWIALGLTANLVVRLILDRLHKKPVRAEHEPWRAINLSCGAFHHPEADTAIAELRRRGWTVKKVGQERTGLVWLRLSAPGVPEAPESLRRAMEAATTPGDES